MPLEVTESMERRELYVGAPERVPEDSDDSIEKDGEGEDEEDETKTKTKMSDSQIFSSAGV